MFNAGCSSNAGKAWTAKVLVNLSEDIYFKMVKGVPHPAPNEGMEGVGVVFSPRKGGRVDCPTEIEAVCNHMMNHPVVTAMGSLVMFVQCCHEYHHGVEGHISHPERFHEYVFPDYSCSRAVLDDCKGVVHNQHRVVYWDQPITHWARGPFQQTLLFQASTLGIHRRV